MQTIAASEITPEKRQDNLFVSNNFTGCRLFRGHVAVRGK